MNHDRSTSRHSRTLLALLLLTAASLLPAQADLPDPCGGSSTVAMTHDGDMTILLENEDSSRRRRAAVADSGLLWPEGKVYYTIDSAFSGEQI